MKYIDDTLRLDDIEVTLPAPIGGAVEVDEFVVVQLDTLGAADRLNTEHYRRNVWGIESDGTTRWRIEAGDRIDGHVKPYTDVWMEDNALWAYNWNGITYKIDPTDGSHCDSRVMR
ncbi:hypothetical protein [Natrialba sp. INN-245]|uniref:hypothetical protein n=1 Tax=Natrialba sp. INN-245 TaxID=2690967 RepID=UPI0013128182|nr:hypothetical protein [Natrialba sp. INN-245]MWV40747.1 hypothetical protein [Natrialba sp. INN-245]